MSRRHFSILAVLTLVVIALVVLLVPVKTGDEGVGHRSHVLPGLAERINQATALELRGAGRQTLVTLQRGEDAWRIEQLQAYPADWATLQGVLAGLAQARILELKTDNPDYYQRLGVEDPAAADATGLELVLSIADEQFSLVAGKDAAGREGRYLRVAGEARTLLTDFTARLPREPVGWADTNIVDLPAALVAEVSVSHPDGEQVTVRKLSADDTDYVLAGLPEGREPASSWSVNGLGGVLAGLDFEDVRPADAFDWTGATAVRVLGFSGLELDARLLRVDEQWWLQLEASAPGEAEVTGQADEINARVGGWAYRIPGYKAEAMNKRLEDLLKPEGEA